jgi:hypothetical protein
MKRISLRLVLFLTMGFAALSSQGWANATDISGTWAFSVDLDGGGHGDPTFVFKQDKDSLTGTYHGPLGKYDVTGSIKENKATFGFEFSNDGEKHKVKYEAVIESATKMSGSIDISDGPKGKWTATKK